MGTVAAAVVAFVGASEADSASLVALNNGLPVFHFFLTFYDKSPQKTSIQAFLDLHKTDGDTLKSFSTKFREI